MIFYYPKYQFKKNAKSIKNSFIEYSNLANELIKKSPGSITISTDSLFSYLRLFPNLEYLAISGADSDKVFSTDLLKNENMMLLRLNVINYINKQPVFSFSYTPELKYSDLPFTYFVGIKADQILESRIQNYKDAIIVLIASVLLFWILIFLYFLDIYRPLYKVRFKTMEPEKNLNPDTELVTDDKGFVQLKLRLTTRKKELKSVNNILAATIKSQRSFLKVIGHDLKAPLRNVSGLVDSIFRKYPDILNEDIFSRLTRIKNNVDKERDMISNILKNITSQKKILTYEKIDPNEIIHSIFEDLSFEIQSKNIDIRIESKLPYVFSNRIILKHVFQNLIDNACKYFEDNENNHINICCKDNAKEHIFSIKDTGPGISKELQKTLFHTFEYSQPLSYIENAEGGLGLQLVRTFIEIIDGKIWLESEIGKGSTFFISLSKLDDTKAGIF